MATSVTSLTSPSASQTGASAIASTADATQDEFLQLLVAQLQNQDPTNPVDTTNMVTQLAEVQQLEESISINGNVASILQDMNTLTNQTGASGATGSSGS